MRPCVSDETGRILVQSSPRNGKGKKINYQSELRISKLVETILT